MSKTDDVRKAMMAAMKSGEKERKNALSLLLAALKQKQIDKRAELTEEEENAIILKEIKQTQESIDTAPADRTDIIEECKTKIAVYQEFAPKMMDEAEIRKVVETVIAGLNLSEVTPKEKGLIMKQLMPQVKGRADGGLVNKIVQEILK